MLEKIKSDVSLGQSVGLTATPTVYINGRKFIGNRQEITD